MYRFKPVIILPFKGILFRSLCRIGILFLWSLCGFYFSLHPVYSVSDSEKKEGNGWEKLIRGAGSSGKPAWQPMLKYVAELHRRSTHPAIWPFDYEWEEIGPGYIYGPAFGHVDITHQSLDVMNFYPEHALHQLLNNIRNQEPNGIIPGVIKMPPFSSTGDSASWNNIKGYPPIWVVAVQDYMDITSDKSELPLFFNALIRQITWFENARRKGDGFIYFDIILGRWESGVDEGIRYNNKSIGDDPFVDATCHVYIMYHYAALWSAELKLNPDFYRNREKELRKFIQTRLYAPDDGMFYDLAAIKNRSFRSMAYENLWPLISGAATKQQADKVIDQYILNPSVFLTEHPIPTVGKNDPKFELKMWRGPAWNSITYWVARGCLNYDRKDAAKILLSRALDDSARQFEISGSIWEFYHPFGGNPADLQRKFKTQRNMPCIEYLGHNPLIAMAVMYDKIK